MNQEDGGKEGDNTVRGGYQFILEIIPLPPNSILWKSMWNRDRLPKVNIFIQLRVHEKLLTIENIQKRVFLDPRDVNEK